MVRNALTARTLTTPRIITLLEDSGQKIVRKEAATGGLTVDYYLHDDVYVRVSMVPSGGIQVFVTGPTAYGTGEVGAYTIAFPGSTPDAVFFGVVHQMVYAAEARQRAIEEASAKIEDEVALPLAHPSMRKG